MSEKIVSLADAQGRVEWPAQVVEAMRTLKDRAARVQALVDAAAASGEKIGDLAATMDPVPDRAPARAPAAAGEGW